MSSPSQPTWDSVTYAVNVPLWIFTGLATLLVISRLISRGLLSKPAYYGWDDAILVVSMLMCLTGAALLSAAVTAGTQVRLDDMPGTLPIAFVLDIAANTTYIISIALPKLAVAIFLIRIFNPSRLWQGILLGGCTLVLLLAIAEYIMNWLQCSPAASQWNPWKYPNGKCWNGSVTGDAAYFLGALSAFQDFCLAIYPATQLKKLQMSTQKKILLSLLMGMGLVAGAFAIVKTYQLGNIKGNPANPAGLFNISLYTGLWSAIENSVVIIVACIPTILPLLRWVRTQSVRSWSTISAINLLPTKNSTRSRSNDGDSSTRNGSERPHGTSGATHGKKSGITKTVLALQTINEPHQTV